jgi:hypothetical protein
MGHTTHNKIVSFIRGIADDVLRDLAIETGAGGLVDGFLKVGV